jgi:hypothetical protein
MQRSFKKVADTSGLAGASIMGMTGIIQDSNYGMRGMANNIQFVVPLLGQLVVQTGSLSGAFKSLWSSLMGPLGVMMAFSTGITILERFSMRKKKVAEETDKATQAFAEESAEAAIMFNHLENLVKSNGSLKDIKRTAKEINEKYNTTLNAEKLTLDEIQKSYTNVISSIKQKMTIEAGGKLISEGIQKQQAAEIRLIKAQTKEAETKARFDKDAQEGFKRGFGSMSAYNNAIKEREKIESDIQEAINQQNIGLHASEQARIRLDKLGLFEPEKPEKPEKKKKEILTPDQYLWEEQSKRIAENIAAEIQEQLNSEIKNVDVQTPINNILEEIEIDLGEIEVTGEIFPKNQLLVKFTEGIKDLSNEMKALLQTYVVDVVVSIGDLIGQALVMGGDAFKGSKDEMLKGFADFLGKLGGMMIAFGITLSAFWEGLKNPANAGIVIAAGIAAVVAAGAIKGYLKKQSNSNTIGSMTSSNRDGGSMGSSGYSNNEMYMYSRLDGRDLVLSNQRAVYQQRR